MITFKSSLFLPLSGWNFIKPLPILNIVTGFFFSHFFFFLFFCSPPHKQPEKQHWIKREHTTCFFSGSFPNCTGRNYSFSANDGRRRILNLSTKKKTNQLSEKERFYFPNRVWLSDFCVIYISFFFVLCLCVCVCLDFWALIIQVEVFFPSSRRVIRDQTSYHLK